MKFLLAATLVLVGLPDEAAVAREPSRTGFFRNTRLYSGLHLELWNYRKTQTLEAVLPLYYSMELQELVEGMAVDVVTSPTLALVNGASSVEPNTLFGVANSKVRLSQNISNLVLLTAGLQIPTGVNKLSASQKNAAGAISTQQMSFKVSRASSGLDADFTAATSYEFTEDLVLGLAVGYLLHGSYIPVKNGAKFNPGNELTVSIGADYLLAFKTREISLLGNLVWAHYGADRLAGGKVFEPGDRFSLTVQGELRLPNEMRSVTDLAVLLRTPDKRPATGSGSTTHKTNNRFSLGNYLYFAPRGSFTPHAVLRTSLYTENGYGTGDAVIGGVGAGGVVTLNRTTAMDARLVVEAGTMDRDLILGGELSGGIRYVF